MEAPRSTAIASDLLPGWIPEQRPNAVPSESTSAEVAASAGSGRLATAERSAPSKTVRTQPRPPAQASPRLNRPAQNYTQQPRQEQDQRERDQREQSQQRRERQEPDLKQREQREQEQQRQGGREKQEQRDEIVVRSGDTLWSLAGAHLGPGAQASEIAAEWPRWFDANRKAIGGNPDHLIPGDRLRPPGRKSRSGRHRAETPAEAARTSIKGQASDGDRSPSDARVSVEMRGGR